MLSARELELLAEELNARLAGRRLGKIYGAPPESFIFRFQRRGEDDLNLLIALDSPLPRVNLVAERPAVPSKPPPFVELLRRELKGGRLEGVDTVPGDRVVRLRFSCGRGEAVREERLVIIELLPGLRNLVVTGEAGVIRLCLRTGRKKRPQVCGQPYVLPDPASGQQESESGPFEFLDERPVGKDLSTAIEEWIAPEEKRKAQSARSRFLLGGLRRSRKRTRRLLSKLEAELAGLADARALRRQGEVLKVNLGQVRRGATSVVLPDWSEGSERSIEVALDPRLGPRENVERLFKLAKKTDRARPRLESRLADCREMVEAIADLLRRASAAEDADTLHPLAEEAAEKGLIRSPPLGARGMGAAPEAAGKEPLTRQPYRTFISKDGLEILVGRTSADNDVLTFRVARGNDYWFHVADHPGSHVVVRGDRELPHETLLDAATLAAHYSKAPRGGAHDVSWTRRKWVKKFRGASAGQVQLAERKTIRIRLEADRLARLRGR